MDPATSFKLLDTICRVIGYARGPQREEDLARARVVGEAKGTLDAIQLYREAGLNELALQHSNVVDVAKRATSMLTTEANPEEVSVDWIRNFYDKCRLTSDEEMKSLWAKILAGEANSPGTFSKRTVTLVGQLDKSDAEDFSRVASFILEGTEPVLFIKNWSHSIFCDAGITHKLLLRLQDAGLLNSETWNGYRVDGTEQAINFRYFGKIFRMTRTDTFKSEPLVPSIFFLTTSGKQLYPVSGPTEQPKFLEYLMFAFLEDKQRGWTASVIEGGGANPPV